MMISICIYCGENKSKALDICEGCNRTPGSHNDRIHSIIVCFSEQDEYLNFITFDELNEYRETIISGRELKVDRELFSKAEEAYSAVNSLSSPQLFKYFSNISHSLVGIVLFLIMALIFLGS